MLDFLSGAWVPILLVLGGVIAFVASLFSKSGGLGGDVSDRGRIDSDKRDVEDANKRVGDGIENLRAENNALSEAARRIRELADGLKDDNRQTSELLQRAREIAGRNSGNTPEDPLDDSD